MAASLIILAAGLGTRFKDGIKQLTPVGKKGELLIEYSIYDAVSAGFDEVIFVIRRDIEQQFKELIGDKVSKKVKVSYCFQDIKDLPEGFSVPEGRTKPWGTVQAVLSAAEKITQPFLIINADDYYGKDSYKEIFKFISSSDRKPGEQCMGGFILKNTLSATGSVTRGVCSVNECDDLVSVKETYHIARQPDETIKGEYNGIITDVDEDSVVSMNMWGCGEEIIPMLQKCFSVFLHKAQKDNSICTAEFALPSALDELIRNKEVSVKVIKTSDKWLGMTHKEDCTEIIKAFENMAYNGEYPLSLF